jgi:glutamyl-tRNA reductase
MLVDIAIISTNSLNYAITKEMMTSVIKKRQYKPLFILDVGVPSIIDPAIEDIDEVFLYNLDDLERIALKGKNQRGSALVEAEQIIDEELERFTKRIKGKNIEPLLKEIINSMNQDRLEVLKEKPNLSSEAVSQLLVNRLLHIPITTIKELYTDEELDEKTELLIRKLLISRAKWKGDTGEF